VTTSTAETAGNPPEPQGVPAERWLRRPGALAALAPSEGFNCSAFRVALPGGEWLPVLAEAPDWAALTARPSFYGNPLLFPFAYGVAGGRLRFAGQEHDLAPTRWQRVSHGLVRDHRWSVERSWEDAAGAHVRATISSRGDAQKLAEYPFPFHLAVTYTLAAGALTLEAKATNAGDAPMPFAFAIHPYVPLPLGTPGTPATARPSADLDEIVRCDATHVGADGPAPGGTAPPALAPVHDTFDLRAGQTVADLLAAQEARRGRSGLFLTYARRPAGAAPGGLTWSLSSPRLGATVEIRASEALRSMVLFAPNEPTPVISPVIGTCLPGFLDYPDDPRQSADLGLLVLAPGATWTASATISVRSGE
jgi:galactose mutarotase-like enzyme